MVSHSQLDGNPKFCILIWFLIPETCFYFSCSFGGLLDVLDRVYDILWDYNRDFLFLTLVYAFG